MFRFQKWKVGSGNGCDRDQQTRERVIAGSLVELRGAALCPVSDAKGGDETRSLEVQVFAVCEFRLR